jgi:hypothetical protein
MYNAPTDEPVDGFSDTQGETTTGEPDPGVAKGAQPPLSPEEYARLQKEARETEDGKA